MQVVQQWMRLVLMVAVYVVGSVVELLLLVHRLVEKEFGQLNVYMLFCMPIILLVYSRPSHHCQHYICWLVLLLMFC